MVASVDSKFELSDRVLKVQAAFGRSVNLPSGAHRVYRLKVQAPQTLPPGPYHLIAIITPVITPGDINSANNVAIAVDSTSIG